MFLESPSEYQLHKYLVKSGNLLEILFDIACLFITMDILLMDISVIGIYVSLQIFTCPISICNNRFLITCLLANED